ncbi:hypothetical protein [Photobacterium leiognathi]|uniref:hypothetical protein n=1 Tax=Photobacterium leiognathi TaxID=553611 RepID=UPI0029828933|nr:hypothetical protein [Photobacterium leiognathi]
MYLTLAFKDSDSLTQYAVIKLTSSQIHRAKVLFSLCDDGLLDEARLDLSEEQVKTFNTLNISPECAPERIFKRIDTYALKDSTLIVTANSVSLSGKDLNASAKYIRSDSISRKTFNGALS